MPVVTLPERKLDMNFNAYGNGPHKVVLVNGFMTTYHGWCEQVATFLDHSETYTVLVFDNRGVGRSSLTKFPPYGTPTMAEDVLCLLDHLKWQTFHLVGISMGGMISLEMASKAPERLLSLMLINTHAGGLGAFPPVQGLLTVLWGMLRNDMTAGDRTKYGNVVYNDASLREKLNQRSIDSWLQLRKYETNHELAQELIMAKPSLKRPPQFPLSTFLYQGFGTIFHHLSEAQLRSIRAAKIPTTVVVSTDDYLVRPTNGLGIYAVMKAPHVRLHRFENGGHAIIIEAIDQFNELLLEHLATVRAYQADETADKAAFRWSDTKGKSVVIASNL